MQEFIMSGDTGEIVGRGVLNKRKRNGSKKLIEKAYKGFYGISVLITFMSVKH